MVASLWLFGDVYNSIYGIASLLGVWSSQQMVVLCGGLGFQMPSIFYGCREHYQSIYALLRKLYWRVVGLCSFYVGLARCGIMCFPFDRESTYRMEILLGFGP